MANSPASRVVALVDDDISVRPAIRSLLRSDGFAVESFASAEDYLSSPRRNIAACLVVDLRLPGISGLDLLQLLAAQGCGIPTVCITGQRDDDRRIEAQALRAGALALLYKPFDGVDLLTRVRGACGLP
jgi:FixJ family two-component response regulator